MIWFSLQNLVNFTFKKPHLVTAAETQEQGHTCRSREPRAEDEAQGWEVEESDQMQNTHKGRSWAELGGAPHLHLYYSW